MRTTYTGIIAAAALGSVTLVQAANRDYISIVGSSTVYPFATAVAERFGKLTSFKTPKIESTGSGGGLKLFCKGVGVEHPDVTNASRRIKASELEQCRLNGVRDIVEVLIGYDGIVLANSKSAPRFELSRRDIFLALAKRVPDPAGGEKLVDNPYKMWNEINAALPASKIEVLGPPPTSGTRDAFNELAIEGGCKSFAWLKAMAKKDKSAYQSICRSVREDGAYVEAGENDNLIVQKLSANPNALGVFGFSFLDQNADLVQGSVVDGNPPTFDAIVNGEYAISRPLYFYVKKAHIGKVPGIAEYLKEFTSEKAWGEEGYLADKGMIPLADGERRAVKKSVVNLDVLTSLAQK
ncbi:MAG: PstS family phosphate ABC transporter substrate-binding protein [Gammaproteobacteria bacterium]|nr:PstS family phosphate ABC transporter substrate-binding protein [Gammaproteobacteria bacterium]